MARGGHVHRHHGYSRMDVPMKALRTTHLRCRTRADVATHRTVMREWRRRQKENEDALAIHRLRMKLMYEVLDEPDLTQPPPPITVDSSTWTGRAS